MKLFIPVTKVCWYPNPLILHTTVLHGDNCRPEIIILLCCYQEDWPVTGHRWQGNKAQERSFQKQRRDRLGLSPLLAWMLRVLRTPERNGIQLAVEVPYEETSAGLEAAQPDSLTFSFFSPVKWRGGERKGGGRKVSFHQAWQAQSCQRDNGGRKEHVLQVTFSSHKP